MRKTKELKMRNKKGNKQTKNGFGFFEIKGE